MAFAIPLATAIGGGSAATGAVLLAASAVSAVSAVSGATAMRAAGKAEEAQANIDANAEGDAAREREIQRKKNLLRAISSQQAAAGAAGIKFTEGSPAAIANLDIAEANRDLRIDTASTRQRQVSLRAKGRAARFTANAQANKALLDTALSVGKTLSGGL